MSILLKAKELGEAIANSDEMKALKEAEIKVDGDEAAKKLLNDYSDLQTKLMDSPKSEEIEATKESIISKYQEISDYEITGNYLNARKAFDSLMNNINEIIMYATTGNEASGCSDDGCGDDGCSSCCGCQ